MYINFYLHFIYFYKKIKDKIYKKCYVYNIFTSNHSFFFFFENPDQNGQGRNNHYLRNIIQKGRDNVLWHLFEPNS